jgi:hypothetical protein
LADGFFRRRRAWRNWRIWRSRTWSSHERGSQREEERSDYYSMENPLKPAIGLHHVADCSRAKPCTQTLERGLTSEKATLCIASVSCGDSPASVCAAYVLRFSPYVFSSGSPYRRGICAGDVDPNTKRVRFQLVVMINRSFRKRRKSQDSDLSQDYLNRAGGI